MADISKITLPNNVEYDIKDATARRDVGGKQDTITVDGILQGDGEGNITAAASSTATTLNNPASDGTYVLKNTVSSGTSTLSWESGGGSVTSVGVSNATNGGLSISGSPITSSGTITIGHSNVLTNAQTTQAVYPIKIDKNGHISDYGSAVTIPEPEIFWCTYDVTTSSEITAAQTAGKICVVQVTIQEGPMSWPVICTLISNAYSVAEFICLKDTTLVSVACSMDTWALSTQDISLTNHTHGNITSSGDITATAPTIASGDKLIINDESASRVTNGPAFGTSTTTFLRNDGTWAEPNSGDSLPSQTGNSGKFLTTDGTDASWATVDADSINAVPKTVSTSGGNISSTITNAITNSVPTIKFRTDDSWDYNQIEITPTSTVIHNVPTPTADGDAANKKYVDDAIPSATSTTPKMDGTAAVGTETTFAKGDHVHPTDTSRQAKITASGILKGDGSGGVTAATAGTDYQSPLPSQTNNSGKFLTTNGTAMSWATITQDDHKWGGVDLAASGANLNKDVYVPSVETMSNTSGTAYWAKATNSPANYCIAKYDGNSYLYSTTPSSSDNSTKVATTAYVTTAVSGVAVPQASTTTPSMDGTASYGSGTTWARADHVHPTDTSRQATITASGILEGDGTGTITAADTAATSTLSIDTTVTASSNHLVTSGAVATAISNIDALPSQTGNSGKYLTTNGTTASWGAVATLPSQTGNSGKYLTTNGTTASWGAAATAGVVTISNTPASGSSDVVSSGGIYNAINNKVNRTTAVNVADTNYTTLMARGVVMLDSTTYDAVSNWSTYLVNGAIAWRYE